jgi:predicted DNA-binding protein (MmcQ/YjbR family)
MIRDMVEDSYDLVVATLSRRQQEQLGWARLAQGGQA